MAGWQPGLKFGVVIEVLRLVVLLTGG